MIFILILSCTGCAKHTIHTTNILVKYDWILSRAIKKREREEDVSALGSCGSGRRWTVEISVQFTWVALRRRVGGSILQAEGSRGHHATAEGEFIFQCSTVQPTGSSASLSLLFSSPLLRADRLTRTVRSRVLRLSRIVVITVQSLFGRLGLCPMVRVASGWLLSSNLLGNITE